MTLTEDNNGWIEYKKFVLNEFERLHEVVERQEAGGNQREIRLREEFQKALDKTERRICRKLDKLEKVQTGKLEKLEIDVKKNSLNINTLQVKAAGWGAVSGGLITLVLELIKLIN